MIVTLTLGAFSVLCEVFTFPKEPFMELFAVTQTRRTFLGASLSTLVIPAWIEPAAAQAGARTRYSATSTQGKANLVKYARAVDIMTNQVPKGDPRNWEFQWYAHWIPGPIVPWSAAMTAKNNMLNQVYAGKPPTDPQRLLAQAMWDTCQAHTENPNDPNFFQELFFLPWHRYFVYYFEEIIRGVLNDTTFTLPYWDYLSGNVADLSIPPEFRDPNSKLFRGNRNAWVNAGERIDKQNPGSMNLNAFRETPLHHRQRRRFLSRPRRKPARPCTRQRRQSNQYGKYSNSCRRSDFLAASLQHRPVVGELEPAAWPGEPELA